MTLLIVSYVEGVKSIYIFYFIPRLNFMITCKSDKKRNVLLPNPQGQKTSRPKEWLAVDQSGMREHRNNIHCPNILIYNKQISILYS